MIKGISVSTIIGNNKLSQVRALDHNHDNSFISCSNDSSIKSIQELLEARKSILESMQFKNLLGCSVPNYITTRWIFEPFHGY